MKHSQCLWLFAIILIANACHKDANKPTNFPSTSYQSLSPYDASGVPDKLLKDTVPTMMLNYIQQIIRKGVNMTVAHPEFFTGNTNADLAIKNSASEVFVTFVSGNASFSNTLAFYTYPTNQPPTSDNDVKLITYIFPNAGKNNGLQAGDKMSLGKFNVGTTIGFVVLQNGWDTTKKALKSDVIHFCSTDALNPETDPNLKKHAIWYNNYTSGNDFLISFEDTNRSSPNCDNDFADVIFYCTINPQ